MNTNIKEQNKANLKLVENEVVDIKKEEDHVKKLYENESKFLKKEEDAQLHVLLFGIDIENVKHDTEQLLKLIEQNAA